MSNKKLLVISIAVKLIESRKKIKVEITIRKNKENFCLAPFFNRADRIAIPKSSLLADI